MINENSKNYDYISVIGLGYVGLPIAVAFAENGCKVIGFDINESKIAQYKRGIDTTQEVGNKRIKQVENLEFTFDPKVLELADFHIVAVPTPVDKTNKPDLKPIISASAILGKHLKKGSIVVYESTVYPGLTEDVCVKTLEKESGLKCGVNFKIGYSPERINPGDKEHRLENIIKIVSGMDAESLDIIARVYSIVAKAGVYKAPSIKVAEAAKIIENAQRDINIAFMNELALIFDKMGIDTGEVLKAAGTKWNFLNFKPGLVGGHCIGVDPYYLAHKAMEVDHLPEVILAGRKINDNMGKFIADKLIAELLKWNISPQKSKVAILGLTFKENCPDLRNSKVYDIILELKKRGVTVLVTDSETNKEDAYKEYGIDLMELNELNDADAIIIAVAHNSYTKLSFEEIGKIYNNDLTPKILFDIKSVLNKEEAEKIFKYWRL